MTGVVRHYDVKVTFPHKWDRFSTSCSYVDFNVDKAWTEVSYAGKEIKCGKYVRG